MGLDCHQIHVTDASIIARGATCLSKEPHNASLAFIIYGMSPSLTKAIMARFMAPVVVTMLSKIA
jgi:hypothetical protein